MIKFNKPYFTGNETKYIKDAILNQRKVSGNGYYTQKCQDFFEQKFNFNKCLLTTSCTDALEMAAILIDIQPGDEVIIPSYTFVSTCNAFVLRGAKIVFADSKHDHPNIDENKIEALITEKTKAIVPVHYAGVACEMDTIMEIAKKHGLYVIEDAAQAIDSYYNDRPLGSIGDLSTFSFHETKNIISGEGGLLVINNSEFEKRAEVIWEKGTNRTAFFRGEVDKYGWVDVGSSFLPSDMIGAFLWAQLENLEIIQEKRKHIWNRYNELLQPLSIKGYFKMSNLPDYATNNAHMYYIVCNSIEDRSNLISEMKKQDIHPVFHYLSLHQSEYYCDKHDKRELTSCDKFANNLVRLPFYFELSDEDILKVVNSIGDYFDV